MARIRPLTQLVVTLGSINSNVLYWTEFDDCSSIAIEAPAAIDGIAKLQVSVDDGLSFTDLQSPPGTDVTLAAGKTIVLSQFPFRALRINTSIAQTAGRNFPVTGHAAERFRA